MTSANSTVRMNAVCLFVDVFPLINPQASLAQADQQLNQQFTTLSEILVDSSPLVRTKAVEGVCMYIYNPIIL